MVAWTRAHVTSSVVLLALVFAGSAQAAAPLTQGFEDGAPAWTATGMWHVQSDPQAVSVAPAIRDDLVTLPDAGALPAPEAGASVAWFGQAATGTYCGSDFASIKQTPSDGCTSTQVQRGDLTSPSFSLAGQSSAVLVFRAWWEIEAVNADIADQMRVEYSTDGGTSWQLGGLLNPLDPAWGGRHQSFSNDGTRTSGTWQAYAVDLGGAAGASSVRVRFVFDTGDTLRNGFRGLLLDGVAVVNQLGATVDAPDADAFTDAPPALRVTDPSLDQGPDGSWSVRFGIASSYPPHQDVGASWTVRDRVGNVVPGATGHATIPAGQMLASVQVPVTGTGAPYSVSISNPTGGATLAPGAATLSTPSAGLPVITLQPLTLTASPAPATVSVTVGAQMSQPSATAVTADYTVTGADGVVAASGTLTFSPGQQTASTTLSLPADHAPYTARLASPTGAVLDPAAAAGTSTSVASIASAAVDQGSQLVLGVRIAAGDSPTLDSTFFLSAVSGTIRYHEPNGPYKSLPSGTTLELPFGSVVDATAGHALITVDSDGHGALQKLEIWEGKAGIFQFGSPAMTELRLAGGDYSPCVGSSRARRGHRSANHVIRHLWASGTGRFRTKGRFASATIRGTRWLTEDLCLATRVTVAEGLVAVADLRRKIITPVAAGHSLTVSALNSARYRNRRGVHGPKLSKA